MTEDRVRRWLQQFGDNYKQRLMFKILQGLTHYGSDRIRAKLKEAHGVVIRGLTRRVETGRRRRADILVSYLDQAGKSGAHYAKLYADENQVYVDNVVERSRLRDELQKREGVQAIVFVDDFVGTGESAIDYLNRFVKDCGELIQNSGLRVVFIAMCGFAAAQAKLQRAIEDLPVQVHLCDTLDDSARCFSDSSAIFPDPAERNVAMNLAYEKGVMLEKRYPLGYGDCQATVVFEHGCPNNTLPILWSSSKEWEPLFPRH